MKRLKHLLIMSALMIPVAGSAQITDSIFRVVPVEGAHNFRDIGGYKTRDNKTVVSGKIYRAADISQLTDKDMDLLASRNIYTVIDFRGTKESAMAPDRLLPGTEYTLCPAGSDHVGDPNDMISLLKQDDFLLSFYGKPSVQYAGDRYRALFARLLELPEANAALLYHCTAGRDRTGMATALILYMLDVPMETIEADYLASNFYLRNMSNKGYEQIAEQIGVTPEEMEERMKLRPEFLAAFFNALKEEYGSVERFMTEEFRIGEKERAILKNKFTK